MMSKIKRNENNRSSQFDNKTRKKDLYNAMILSETRRNTGRYANGKILEEKEKKTSFKHLWKKRIQKYARNSISFSNHPKNTKWIERSCCIKVPKEMVTAIVILVINQYKKLIYNGNNGLKEDIETLKQR